MPFLMDYCSRVARTGGDTLFWVLMLLFSAGVSVSGFGMIMTVGFDIYSCLYWDGVPFLDFCCPLWISGMCGDCGFSVVNASEFLPGVFTESSR